MKKPLLIAYGAEYLNWNLGGADDAHPTNAIRSLLATEQLAANYRGSVEVVTPNAKPRDAMRLLKVHSIEYVSEVLNDGLSSEWEGVNLENADTALEMFAGTVRCVDAILTNKVQVAFNPQGAKHHAARNHSSGFCVFNDMAWAALEFAKYGYKVMYIDWDAHHGDGVENLLAPYPEIVTASIHDGTIFPGTGLDGHSPKDGIYNWALPAGADGTYLKDAMLDIEELAADIKPNIILLAAGADGHIMDPLSTLNYQHSDFTSAALSIATIASVHTEGKVLIGGAGGYCPMDFTPQAWVGVVSAIYDGVRFGT